MDKSDREKLDHLSFFRGLTEARAAHTTPPKEQAEISDDMSPKVGFGMHQDGDGKPMLSMMLDFSECEVASKLSQRTMMVAIHELTRDSLDALDLFVAIKKRELGIDTRYLADTEDDPPE